LSEIRTLSFRPGGLYLTEAGAEDVLFDLNIAHLFSVSSPRSLSHGTLDTAFFSEPHSA